ncbi:zinc finger, CCHC-type containing protein [Tanacetum coccineum]
MEQQRFLVPTRNLKLECWKCGKTGHFKRDCRSGKKNNANAGGSERLMQLVVVDSGATTHVCKDRCWFKTFEPVEDGSVLYMGDEHFVNIHGKGSVALIFSSGKNGYLFNVLLDPSLAIKEYIHETSAPYHASANGVAERKNRALKEMVQFTCYPNLGLSEGAVVRLPDPKRKTLGEKGIDCIFVGYAEHSKAYRFYVIELDDLFEGSRDQVGSQYSYCYSIEEDPRTYNEAVQSRDAAFWKKAMMMRWFFMEIIHGSI